MEFEELMAIVRRVEPTIHENRAQGERERRVPNATAKALVEAGLLKTWIPKALGGWEVDPITACRMFEEVARIDSGAAWMLQMCSTVSLLGAWFGDEAVAEMHAKDSPVFGDSFAPPMRFVPADDGWEVSGQVTFVSNCHHLDWYFGLGMEFDGEKPKEDCEHYVFAVPRAEFEIVDHWDTLGMRGTGSHDVRIDRVSVPANRAVPFGPLEAPRNAAYPKSVMGYGGPVWLGIASMGSVGLGIAQAAYDEFLEICAKKTANYMTHKVGESALTHARLGEVHAHLNAARSYLYAALGRMVERTEKGEQVRNSDRAEVGGAATFVFQATAHAMDLIAESAGTSLIRDEVPLSRHFRDLRTLTQHVFTSKNRYQDVGLLALDRKPLFEMYGF
ncbi:MAG: acyl-CoA dehydrogenase family protein [Planctomycetota bacterium]|jgi:alkylation response protein AidB-like acyl-CoA dehydrogenase